MSERVLWKVEVEFWTKGDPSRKAVQDFFQDALENQSDFDSSLGVKPSFEVKYVHSATTSGAKPTPPAALAPTVKRRIRRGE